MITNIPWELYCYLHTPVIYRNNVILLLNTLHLNPSVPEVLSPCNKKSCAYKENKLMCWQKTACCLVGSNQEREKLGGYSYCKPPIVNLFLIEHLGGLPEAGCVTQMTQPAFFSLILYSISAEPTLVGRIRGAWWLASLRASVNSSCIFSVTLLYIKVLIYGPSV